MSQILHNEHLSLVYFKTQSNGACHIITPVYEELSKSYKGIADFVSIDVDKQFPTILFFKNGQLVDHVIGLTPKNTLINKIEQALIHPKNTF